MTFRKKGNKHLDEMKWKSGRGVTKLFSIFLIPSVTEVLKNSFEPLLNKLVNFVCSLFVRKECREKLYSGPKCKLFLIVFSFISVKGSELLNTKRTNLLSSLVQIPFIFSPLV